MRRLRNACLVFDVTGYLDRMQVGMRRPGVDASPHSSERLRGIMVRLPTVSGRDPVREVERYARTRDAMSKAVAGNPPITRARSPRRWWKFRGRTA